MPTTTIRTALLLTTTLAGLALSPGAGAQERPEGPHAALVAKVDRRVKDWQPTRSERRLDDIAWAKDLRHALRLAKDHNRPVFLFTYSGCAERPHALALQRC